MGGVLKKTDLVVKSNELIRASYTLGLVEQRLILMAIVTARETGLGVTADTLLEVRAMDYAQLFGVTKQAAYMALTDAVETLFNRRATVQVYDERRKLIRPLTVRWVTAMDHEENTGLITLRFGHEVVPEITRLEGNFTSYELQQVAGLKSSYAVRLYELLIQWRVAGNTPFLEVGIFRSQLGLASDEYPRMEAFKRCVLDVAVKQINEHTDIIVDYEQHKSGRVITGFAFTLTQKKAKEIEKKKSTPKPKKPIAEKQLDWLSSDVLERFNSLPKEKQKAIIDDTETTLKGSHQARFRAAKSSSIDRFIAEFAIEINEGIMRSANNDS
jgi:plasmid replication initiation protein